MAHILGLTVGRVAAAIAQLCHKCTSTPQRSPWPGGCPSHRRSHGTHPLRSFIIDHYHRGDTFHPIVASAEEHTADGSELCEIALA